MLDFTEEWDWDHCSKICLGRMTRCHSVSTPSYSGRRWLRSPTYYWVLRKDMMCCFLCTQKTTSWLFRQPNTMVRWEWFLPLGQIGQLVSLSVRVVALSDLARVHSGAQAFSIRHRIVGLFPLAHSDKTSRLDFVEVFPAITTLKFILFFFLPRFDTLSFYWFL